MGAFEYKCPVCGAVPHVTCKDLEGIAMPLPHTKREQLAQGIAGSASRVPVRRERRKGQRPPRPKAELD